MSLLRGVSFDHLKKKQRDYVLPGCFVRSEKEVVLILQHAGEDNAGWINEYRRLDAEKPMTERTPREWFDALVRPFAQYVVTGWREVYAEAGNAPFNADDVVEIMRAYAAEALDLALRPIYYATSINNFRDYKPKSEAEALGKE